VQRSRHPPHQLLHLARKDKNYAEAFEAAKQIAADNFEDEIYRCGFEGYDKPVTYQGEIKGHSLIARTIVTAFLLTAMNGASLFSIGSGNGMPAKGNFSKHWCD